MIDLREYIETARELLATDPTLTEVFSLDVIGSPEGSRANTEAMWEAGIPAIPCFHYGEPEALLFEMARAYPKIAIGGSGRPAERDQTPILTTVFRAGVAETDPRIRDRGETHIMALPWHSVDATNWESGPVRFGQWHKYGKMSVRGSAQNLRSQVDHYLEIERKARVKWRRELQQLAAPEGGSVRLALAIQREGTGNDRYIPSL